MPKLAVLNEMPIHSELHKGVSDVLDIVVRVLNLLLSLLRGLAKEVLYNLLTSPEALRLKRVFRSSLLATGIRIQQTKKRLGGRPGRLKAPNKADGDKK